MAEEKAKKVNNASKYISKDVIVISVVLIAIAAYIIAECYSATHVDIQTVTAVKSTVTPLEFPSTVCSSRITKAFLSSV